MKRTVHLASEMKRLLSCRELISSFRTQNRNAFTIINPAAFSIKQKQREDMLLPLMQFSSGKGERDEKSRGERSAEKSKRSFRFGGLEQFYAGIVGENHTHLNMAIE